MTHEEPLRVLQVIASTDRRGAEVFAVELGAALAERGLDVSTVALAPGSSGGVDVPTLGRRPRSLSTFRALRNHARRVDVVAAHGSKTLPVCAIALAGTGVSWVYRNIGDPRYWSGTRLRRARVRLALSRASGVVAIASSSRDLLVDEYGIAADRITVIPRAVEASAFSVTTPGARDAAREQLGLGDRAQVVAFVGALSPEKNVPLAIDAVASLPEVTLIVAGDGTERTALELRASSRAPDRVRFLGAVPDPRVVYDAADALVLSSRSEGLPAVAIEAGLCGLPVVTTDAGFVREIVVDGETGVVVPQDDVAALVSGIGFAIEHRASLGVNARARCVSEFSLASAAERWYRTLSAVR